jgi:hypothetical protein
MGFYLFGLLPAYLFYISIGYYIVDSLFELYNYFKTKRTTNLLIVGHHLVSSLVIHKLTDQNDPNMSLMFETFVQVELSNYPVYLVYHLKTIGCTNQLVIKALTLLEIAGYAYLRLYLFGIKIYHAIIFGTFSYLMIVGSIVIYGLSCAWFYAFVSQLFRKPIKEIKQ